MSLKKTIPFDHGKFTHAIQTVIQEKIRQNAPGRVETSLSPKVTKHFPSSLYLFLVSHRKAPERRWKKQNASFSRKSEASVLFDVCC